MLTFDYIKFYLKISMIGRSLEWSLPTVLLMVECGDTTTLSLLTLALLLMILSKIVQAYIVLLERKSSEPSKSETRVLKDFMSLVNYFIAPKPPFPPLISCHSTWLNLYWIPAEVRHCYPIGLLWGSEELAYITNSINSYCYHWYYFSEVIKTEILGLWRQL